MGTYRWWTVVWESPRSGDYYDHVLKVGPLSIAWGTRGVYVGVLNRWRLYDSWLLNERRRHG
jgi:hypothetical protein